MILLGLLGLRLVECSRLRPQHLQENQLAVPTAKGGTPRRIPLAPQLAKTLQRIIAEGPSDRDHNRPDLIFYTAAMNAIAKGGMRDRMQQWTRPLLGEAIAFHRLRHTAATTAYLQHKDPIAVQALLGHKHLSTTTDYLRSILSIDADTMPNYPHPPAIAGGPPRPADDRQTTPIPGRPRPPTIRPDLTTTTSTEEF
jgi:integrase